ncbi:hypothetical protein SELMODRAFT_270695 [Selaginella moellendorffii]|uniref:pyridoxal 5'-phosphate synthase n=1 Tax=Selaginella moellendorffii TaxID=88036 RepID=D8RAV7_SELML|nr:pyridoxine/pyridoxamine 5'-phosphate oxidase 2 [Selaginella moellendorffii]XP_024529284.1 pyridoxine/pyridoxamine 5'-phosphate oxidase 2 [Selaginella moellendorffii]EFJ30696.1 hypothetical protein SELMODRAFT_270695 [Selaginella moellendorffii]|eukprot:XP_002968442.1 pyridoxine/pyridoxamine 5'-phosphate oxidase 2 [Selaginella moellendorffii]
MGERILPWRQLLESALESHSRLRHSRFCQLATVRANGTPANRTVVFRGFADGTDDLLFTTDSRSNKVQEAQHCPVAEVCYYFTDSWEQFRIHGDIEVISHTEDDPLKKEIREKSWFSSSLQTRKQFTWPHPGQPKESHPEEVRLESTQPPVDTFCVVTLHPVEVDYLHLKQHKRIVFRSSSGGDWTSQAVNP